MPKLLPAAIIAAAVAAFIASSLWYSVLFGAAWQSLAGAHGITTAVQGWQVAAQFARNLVVAGALLFILQQARAMTLSAAVPVAGVVWFGFEALAISGAVIHEGYPAALYLIHSGDALLATAVMTLVLTLWPKHN